MRMLVFGFLSLFIVGAALGQVDKASDKLAVKLKHFDEHSSDFLDLSKFSTSDCDFENRMSLDLQTVSSKAFDSVGFVQTLLTVYSQVSNKEDRAKIRFLLQQKFQFQSMLMDNYVKQTNVVLSHTKRPGVVAEAVRMRDDLRETKSILDSIELL